MSVPRVLVVTIVHQPLDARIHARQIRAMRDAGWAVTYAAPWTDTATPPDPNVESIDLPRAVGRARLGPMRAARHVIQRQGPEHDLVLLHDPELVVGSQGLRGLPPVVWDVHEDVAASLADRGWLPEPLKRPARAGVRQVERLAERRHHLLLAEATYQDRFHEPHPVVRNLPWVPSEIVEPPGPGRAVYVGRISHSRGLDVLLAVADRVAPEVTLEMVGAPDAGVRDQVQQAHDRGRLRWYGFMDNPSAMAVIDGATVGLSLLRDEPNFRESLPTKVVEYMGRGIPVVTTPLPMARAAVEPADAGTVVPFDDPEAAAAAVLDYHTSAERRKETGQRGHGAALESWSWTAAAPAFLEELERIMGMRP